MICGVCAITSVGAAAQNLLSHPESAVYDAARERYLVSNYGNGRIIAIDETGTQTVFSEGKSSSAGLHVVGDTLYVGCGNEGVLGLNLETGATVMDLAIPGSQLLNDITSDTSGNLYVSDPYGDKIYRISLDDHSYSTLVDYIEWPNGVLFIERSNRLLACGSTTRNLYEVDMANGSLTILANDSLGHLDGLAEDNEGSIYISAQGIDAVFKYDSTLNGSPELVSRFHTAPADIYYNKLHNVLVVPEIGGASVDFVDFGQPDLHCEGLALVEGGELGRNYVRPGEAVWMCVLAHNQGQPVDSVSATISSLDGYVSVYSNQVSFDGVLMTDSHVTSTDAIVLAINPSCPDPRVARLSVSIEAEDGYTAADTLLLFIGESLGFLDDAESGLGKWRSIAMSTPFIDNWRQNHICPYSDSMSWRTGYSSYRDFMDAGLISPPILIRSPSVLTFWHQIDAQLGNEPGRARDGGLVMLSAPGGEWTQVSPIGGYPCTTAVTPTSPLHVETPVFSGLHDWTQASFDLSGYSGIVQVLFRFASDGSVTGPGWCIDDIAVSIDTIACCSGITGNVDYDSENNIDIGDLTALISYLYIPPNPAPVCMREANVDGDVEGLIDIGDLTALISYLYVPPNPVPAACP
jgi:hypothetical protein